MSEFGSELEQRVQKVIEQILAGNYADGFIDGNPYSIQEYFTKEETECVVESHRQHIDVQYLLEGHEVIKTYAAENLIRAGEYNPNKDIEFWEDGKLLTHSVLNPGSLIVLYNGHPHKCGIACGAPHKAKKLVCKIEV